MTSKCASCNSCGMPLENKEDFALGDPNAVLCKYCVDEKGELLPYETVLKNNAGYFQESQGLTEMAAIKMAKDLMRELPAWKSVGV